MKRGICMFLDNLQPFDSVKNGSIGRRINNIIPDFFIRRIKCL